MNTIIETIASLDFYQVIWLLLPVVLIHVMEELPRFSEWARETLKIPYTRHKFIWENVVLFTILAISVPLTALGQGTPAGTAGVVLVLATAFTLFTNALFHGGITLRSGVYSPGTVTACLLFPGMSILVYYLAWTAGLLTLPVVILSTILGLILLPGVVVLVHCVIDGKIKSRTLIKVAIMALLPPALMAAASAVVDPAVVHKIMIYGGPLALLPLALRWLRRRARAQQEVPSAGAGS